MDEKTIFLMFCVNEPDYGQNTGKADAFEFDGFDTMKIEGLPVTCKRIGRDKLKISRRTFPILSYGSWIGNWCWDGARVTVETANEIAAYLKSLGKFDCVEGEESLYDAWHENKIIDFRKTTPPTAAR